MKPAPDPVVINHPARVEIPSIGVDAPVVQLGLNADGTMEVPGGFAEVGWLEPGPEPGEPGASVIAGHVDSKTGPAVFYKLDRVEPGDSVAVRGKDGTSLRFKVVQVEQYQKDEFPTQEVYGATSGPELRLITCGGTFNHKTGHYLDNIVVYAVLSGGRPS